MKRDRLAMFFEMGAALLFAMIGVIIFGFPEGSIASGALVIWMFTFMQLNRKLSEIQEELRHVRKVSKMRSDDSCPCRELPVVPLPKEDEEEEETW